jgi:hypothetical protein
MPAAAQSHPNKSKVFPLWRFDESFGTCRAKGRLQDRDYCHSTTMDTIIARGKEAVPILISQLTDARAVKEPIFDFWNQMTVGDIAHAILGDLFTDSDWTTFNLPGVKSWDNTCKDPAETCWHRYVKVHGRRFIQRQWLTAWNTNEDRIYWDADARCFRLSKEASPAPAPKVR